MSPSTASALVVHETGEFQPRELREALQCPFSYFARRRLRVRPQRLRARWFSLADVPRIGSLYAQPTESEAYSALESALAGQIDQLYSEVPEWEIGLLRSGGSRLIREWVQREFAARRLWPKENVLGEVRFGTHGLRDILPKAIKLSGSVPAISRLGPYTVVHLVEPSGPTKAYGAANELIDQDKLYYGLHLLAAWTSESAGAVEIETMSGERFLLVLPRVPGVDLTGRVGEGLRVIDLAGSEDSGGTKAFFDDVKELATLAARSIEAVDVRALKGEHCTWCDYGELCRQSFEFGEDSPFAIDS